MRGRESREKDRDRDRTEERRKRALSTNEPCSSQLQPLHHRPPFFPPPTTLYLSFSTHPAPSSLLFESPKKCALRAGASAVPRRRTSLFPSLYTFSIFLSSLSLLPCVHLRPHPPSPFFYPRYQQFRSLSTKDARQKRGASASKARTFRKRVHACA